MRLYFQQEQYYNIPNVNVLTLFSLEALTYGALCIGLAFAVGKIEENALQVSLCLFSLGCLHSFLRTYENVLM